MKTKLVWIGLLGINIIACGQLTAGESVEKASAGAERIGVYGSRAVAQRPVR